MKSNYLFFGQTDKGIRETNDDSFKILQKENGNLIAVVCDGIGSQKGSFLASNIICEEMVNFFKKNQVENVEKWFSESIKKAYESLTNQANKLKVEVGTTMVLVVIKNNVAHCFNIGDSRCYFLHNKKILQITSDHNLINYFKKSNASEEIIFKNKDNLFSLVNFIESNNWKYVKWDHFEFKVSNNDLIYLLTDGVYNFINNYSFSNTNNPQEISWEMIQCAKLNKSTDNMTTVVIKKCKN